MIIISSGLRQYSLADNLHTQLSIPQTLLRILKQPFVLNL